MNYLWISANKQWVLEFRYQLLLGFNFPSVENHVNPFFTIHFFCLILVFWSKEALEEMDM